MIYQICIFVKLQECLGVWQFSFNIPDISIVHILALQTETSRKFPTCRSVLPTGFQTNPSGVQTGNSAGIAVKSPKFGELTGHTGLVIL